MAEAWSRNGTPARPRLGPRGSLFYCADQQIGNKRLVQKNDATCALRLHSRDLIVKGGHENNRKLAAGCCQVVPQLDPGHATQVDIDEQAIDVCRGIEVEEHLGGSKDFGGKSICPPAPAYDS